MHSPANSWKFYFRADHETLQWGYLLKALTQHEQCLLVLQLPDQVTIAIQFLAKCKVGEDLQVDSGTVSGYLYSSNFGYRKKYILGSNYRLDLNKNAMQLYRRVKNRTFVCLKAVDYSKESRFQLGDENAFPISVDLLSFDRKIFTGSRPHPLINKIPFIKMEVFVEDRNGVVPYFDTVIPNDIEFVVEIEDLEEEEDESDDTNLSYLLSDEEIDHKSIETESHFKAALRVTTTACQPIVFGRILDSWLQKHNSAPAFVQDMAVALVENIVLMTVPLREDLPEAVSDAITHILLVQSFQDASKVFKLAGLLSRLHLNDLVVSLLVQDFGSFNFDVTSFLEMFGDWQTWWFIKHEIAKQSIRNAAQVALKYPVLDGKLSEVRDYVLELGQLHFQELLLDMKSVQERMRTAKADLSIPNLKIESSLDEKWEIVSFTRSAPLSHRPRITQGQYIAITRQVDFRRNPCHESCCCLAQVKAIRTAPLAITVKLLGEVPMTLKKCSEKTRLWKIDLIANITTFTRVMDALKKLSALKQPLPSLIEIVASKSCSPQHSPLDLKDTVLKDTDTLNPTQKEAVRLALSQTVTLIQGPPGTGKTTVACEIIKQMKQRIDHKRSKLLVVSETNIAVDNIVKSLRKDLPLELLRIGTAEGVDREVYDLSLEGQLLKMEESEGTKTSYRDDQGMSHRKKNAVKKIFSNASVVLTTCAGAGDLELEPYTFEYVLVDEATQTKETTLLCSLMHGVKQLVMIGDHKQLGPIVLHDKPDPLLIDLPDVTSLSKTLFHRLYTSMPSILLETQHRMHPELVKFPSEEFYEGKLKSGVTVENRPRPIFPWPDKGKPLCFIDVPSSREEKLETSFCNKQEIKVIQQVLDKLLNVPEDESEHRLSITDIGILTFYQGQARLLSGQIKPKVEVRSVDGFQGREKEVIIVSTVRSNDQGSLGFTESPNRMNVMLTRAKRGLLIVGSLKTLSSSDLWKRWLQSTPKLDLNDLSEAEISASVKTQATASNRRGGAVGGKTRHTENRNKNNVGGFSTRRQETPDDSRQTAGNRRQLMGRGQCNRMGRQEPTGNERGGIGRGQNQQRKRNKRN